MGGIFHWQGSLPLEARITWHLLPAHLETCLKGERASFTLADAESVLFRVHLFRFVSRSNVLTPFDRGELRIDRSRRLLTYTLSLKRLLLSAAAGLLGFVPLLTGSSAGQERLLWLLPPFVWLITLLQAWVSVYRFRRFLLRSVASAPAVPAGVFAGRFPRAGTGNSVTD